VSESLRGFAHEVRNPLAAISGAAQLLEQRADDSRQRELAQLIRDESARLASLAERLLGARTAMATRAVNVHAVLERAAELLETECADVVVVRDYDPSLPAWHGDPDRLLQAVLNLVRNSAEARAGRIVLRSRAEAGWRDAQGQRVPALRIEIEDDGDGVPDAIATTLFEPMVSGRAGGTGLGLALAREIVREHGGELTLQRRQAGSCFVLLLPRHPRTEERA
jgi:two-component system nitrogen regulation sensor histidine kinase GlnL